MKVDDFLRSSDPNIYAVGEVASYEGGRGGDGGGGWLGGS